jgi:hypothetical protein
MKAVYCGMIVNVSDKQADENLVVRAGDAK